MRRWHSWLGLAVFLTGVTIVSTSHSQDKEKGEAKTTAKAAKDSADKPATKGAGKSAKDAKETKHRLPRHYGKLGLTDAQREKIYAVQDKYATEIDKLEKQLADLKSKQEADCRKVLNADQKKQLADATEAAKAKAAKAEADEEQ